MGISALPLLRFKLCVSPALTINPQKEAKSFHLSTTAVNNVERKTSRADHRIVNEVFAISHSQLKASKLGNWTLEKTLSTCHSWFCLWFQRAPSTKTEVPAHRLSTGTHCDSLQIFAHSKHFNHPRWLDITILYTDLHEQWSIPRILCLHSQHQTTTTSELYSSHWYFSISFSYV